jgi:hypothetical protein
VRQEKLVRCQNLSGALNQNKKPKADYIMKNKYNLAARAAVVALVLTATFVFTTSASAASYSAYGPGGVNTAGGHLPDSTLWYNGDFDGVNGLANGQNTGFTAAVYDDFNVTGPGWNVNAAFTNDLLTTAAGITTANWEIRSGVSEGNGGTLLFSGLNAPVTVTPTGRSGFGLTEYTVQVNGLSVTLGAGTYWISVQPIGNGSQISYNSSTIGANCIGTPCGNNDNAFINSASFGFNFHTTTDPQFAPGNIDFSDGVIGTVVPEPATWALLGLGTLLVAVRRRRSA